MSLKILKKFKIIVLGVVVGLLLASCSTTQSYGSAQESAIEKTMTAADKGKRYLLGQGVVQSDTQAFYYFKQAADRDDDAFAQSELAYMYASGKGTEQNSEKAFYYYKKAAESGLAGAQYNLGLLYLHGIGTERNHAEALQWFQKAAAHGFEPAKIALSRNG